MKFERITVNAIVDGDSFYLVDANLERISKLNPLSVTNEPESQQIVLRKLKKLKHKRRVSKWINRMLDTMVSRNRLREERSSGTWMAKAAIWLSSVQIRRRRPQKNQGKGARKRDNGYKTITWPEAIERMRCDAKARAYRATVDGWDKWANTVSNNIEKRKGGKHYDGF